MRLLVTGRTGQLAQSLLERCRPDALDIVALGRPDLDLADAASIEAGIRRAAPRLVINAAAYTAVDKAESEQDLAQAINAIGAGHVAAACRRLDLPMIQISTDYVFDGRKPTPYVETDPVAPRSVYGRTKLEGERRVAAACPRHVILRTAWVYSPFGRNFVSTMLGLAATRPEIGVVDDQRGCPTSASHLADAVIGVAQAVLSSAPSAEVWGVYHAAGRGVATWCDFAREIFRCASERGVRAPDVRAIATTDYPTPAERPANSQLDSSKLERVFGLRLPDWKTGVADCVARLCPDPNGR